MTQATGVPVIDVPYRAGIEWNAGLGDYGRSTGALLAAFEQQVVDAVGRLRAFLLKGATGALNGLLGSHFQEEARGLAQLGGGRLTSVLVANLAYDLSMAVGCSTFVTPVDEGVMHARNLDWEFPRRLLQKHVIVARVRGAPCGDYAMVTWPGFFGGLTALAPGRFSITVNFVKHPEAMDATGLGARAAAGAWPVPWAVRKVLDEASSFSAAVRQLSRLPLLSPVLLTVAGTELGEAVVIECKPGTAHVTRTDDTRPLWITNHYARSPLEQENVDEDVMETQDRFACLARQLARPPAGANGALRLLGHRALTEGGITQHRVVMNARRGELWLRVPGRRDTLVSA